MGAMPIQQALQTDWVVYSLILSCFFISGFWFVGSTVQKYGVGVATLMQKMSIILSVMFMMLIWGESTHYIKILGIILALLSILLYNHQSLRNRTTKNTGIIFPLMAWVISGIIEIFLFLAQESNTIQGAFSSFTTMIFAGAGAIGFLVVLANKGLGRFLNVNNILAGVILGVPNFFSIYFLMRVLNIGWEGSVVFPINNIGVLIISSIGAMLVFDERIGPLRWLGLALAVCSIVLLTTFT